MKLGYVTPILLGASAILLVSTSAFAIPQLAPTPKIVISIPSPVFTPRQSPTPPPTDFNSCVTTLKTIEDCVGIRAEPEISPEVACYRCAVRFCETIDPDFHGTIDIPGQNGPEKFECSQIFCLESGRFLCGLPILGPPRSPSPSEVPFTG